MYTVSILTLNFVCIILLFVMTTVLIVATSMRSGSGHAAVIIFLGTIPSHIFNMTRSAGMFDVASATWYLSFSNTLMIPLLWLFVIWQLKPDFKFKPAYLFHLTPTIVSIVCAITYWAPMSHTEQIESLIRQNTGYEPWPALLNDIIVFGQMVSYFPAMLLFTRKFKCTFRDNSSDYDLFQIKWIQSFIIMSFSLFIIVFIGYAIYPRTDAWLIPILNILLTSYLIYQCIKHPTQTYWEEYKKAYANLTDKSIRTNDKRRSVENIMESTCTTIISHLKESRAYTNPDLTVWNVATSTGISPTLISQSINGHLNKSFFELVNEMRIDEVKTYLLNGSTDTLTIEAITRRCGFRSRSSFYTAFNKFEQCTPKQWIRQNSVKTA